ncbi:MAG: hypothetical protein IPL10_15630 [Bacteroidetes bacterium]|nr:hypothetical protein [Bacteroidota bacterium]
MNEVEYSNYEVKEYNLKISYPKDWDTTNLDQRMILTILEHKTSKQDTFKENIVLYKTQLPNHLTLDSVLNLATNTLYQQYGKVNVIEKKISKNAMNKDYATFTMILPQNGVDIVSSTYYFPVLNDFYVLDFGYNRKDSVKYRPICDKVVNSLSY